MAANANTPLGLTPRRHASGSHYNAAINPYAVLATDATPLCIGDPVVVTGAGDATAGPGGITGIAVVTRAGATGAVTGVVVGLGTSLITTGYRPASTYGVVLVNDDPDTLYEIQDNANGGVTMDGSNANMVISSPNLFTKRSTVQLDSSTSGTAATLQLKVIRGQDRVDVDPTVANGKWLVKLNNITTASNSTGV